MAEDGEPTEQFQVDNVYRGHEDMNSNGIPDYQDARAADSSTVIGQGAESSPHAQDRSHEYGPDFDQNEPYERSQTEPFGTIAAGPDVSDAEYDPASKKASEQANATASQVERDGASKTPLEEMKNRYSTASKKVEARRLQSDAKKQRSTLFGEMMAQKPHKHDNHNGTELAHEVWKGILAGISHDRKQAAIAREAKAEKIRRAQEDLDLADNKSSIKSLEEAAAAAATERGGPDGSSTPGGAAGPAAPSEEKTVDQTIRRGNEGPEGPGGGEGGPGGGEGGAGGGQVVVLNPVPAAEAGRDQSAGLRAAELGAAEANLTPSADPAKLGPNEAAQDPSVQSRAAELGRSEGAVDKAIAKGGAPEVGKVEAPAASVKGPGVGGDGASVDPAKTTGKVMAGAAANIVAPGVGAVATAATLRDDQKKAGAAHEAGPARGAAQAPSEPQRQTAGPASTSAAAPQSAPRRLAAPQRREASAPRMGGLREQAASLPAPAAPSARALPRGVPTPAPAPKPAGLGLSLASMITASRAKPENDMSFRPEMVDMKKRGDDMGRGM